VLQHASQRETTVPALTPLLAKNDDSSVQDGRSGDRASDSAAVGARNDEALMAAIAAGDAAALDQLFVRYRPLAFGAAYGVIQDASAAEDVLHDAFLSVWRAASSFRPDRGSLRVWLRTISRNAARDRVRELARARRVQTPLDVVARELSGGDDVATTADVAAEMRRLHAALATLPASQRTVIELNFFGGLSHGEIAARCGVPLGTVKGRGRLGLLRLRRELDGRPGGHCQSPKCVKAAR
jgi:RNA polymerase sigma-70 factor (ECF subfamily)